MLNGKEMKYRIKCACDQNVPITNYGMTIAYIHGVLERSLNHSRRRQPCFMAKGTFDQTVTSIINANSCVTFLRVGIF